MNKNIIKKNKKIRRHIKVRAKISGTKICPRLCVFKSHKSMYAQIINDEDGKTEVSAHSKEVKTDKSNKDGKVAISFALGKIIAGKALKKDIQKIVFDRGGNKYHGRVKAVADGAREGGLEF